MIRTDQQILELLDNSKAFMHQSFEKRGVLLNKGLLPQSDYVSPLQIRASNLIYLTESPYATDIQRNKAADELGRLIVNFNSQDGVFEEGMFAQGVFY